MFFVSFPVLLVTFFYQFLIYENVYNKFFLSDLLTKKVGSHPTILLLRLRGCSPTTHKKLFLL